MHRRAHHEHLKPPVSVAEARFLCVVSKSHDPSKNRLMARHGVNGNNFSWPIMSRFFRPADHVGKTKQKFQFDVFIHAIEVLLKTSHSLPETLEKFCSTSGCPCGLQHCFCRMGSWCPRCDHARVGSHGGEGSLGRFETLDRNVSSSTLEIVVEQAIMDV